MAAAYDTMTGEPAGMRTPWKVTSFFGKWTLKLASGASCHSASSMACWMGRLPVVNVPK